MEHIRSTEHQRSIADNFAFLSCAGAPVSIGMIPSPSQRGRMLTSSDAISKCVPLKSAVFIRNQRATVCRLTPHLRAIVATPTPLEIMASRSRPPNVPILPPPDSFYWGINFTHGRMYDAGRFARLGGKYLPCRLEYFRGRGFFHSPKMMRIKSAPVACAMHASMTAKRGASFNDSSRRTVRALTLQSADVSEVRIPAAFIAARSRSPNVDVLSIEKIFAVLSPSTPLK